MEGNIRAGLWFYNRAGGSLSDGGRTAGRAENQNACLNSPKSHEKIKSVYFIKASKKTP
jgi:hypothetical protein